MSVELSKDDAAHQAATLSFLRGSSVLDGSGISGLTRFVYDADESYSSIPFPSLLVLLILLLPPLRQMNVRTVLFRLFARWAVPHRTLHIATAFSDAVVADT